MEITLWVSIFCAIFEIIFHIWMGGHIYLEEISVANFGVFVAFNSPIATSKSTIQGLRFCFLVLP